MNSWHSMAQNCIPHKMWPLFTLSYPIFLTTSLTFSPGPAQATSRSSSSYILIMVNFSWVGIIAPFIPGWIIPLSILPNNSSWPMFSNLLKIGMRIILFVLLLILGNEFRVSKRVVPLYHEIPWIGSLMFTPLYPSTHTHLMFSLSKPQFLTRKVWVLSWMYLYLSSDQSQVSILFTQTTKYLAPKVLESIACSLVCPFFSKPASNSPALALMTKQAISAWAAP